ncbi:MAG TPA: cytochrome P450 [Thermoleophilaceae bacterium]
MLDWHISTPRLRSSLMPSAATATPTATKLEAAPQAGHNRSTPPRPPGPSVLHGFGMLWFEQQLLARSQRRYGDIFTLKVPSFRNLVVVANPTEIKRMFAGDPTLVHAGRGNRVLAPLVGLTSILLLDEAAHMQQRKLMLPAFHGERMRVYGDLMREATEAEIERWPIGQPFAVHESTQAITLRIICRAVFGISDEGRLRVLEAALVEMLDRGQALIMVPELQRDLGAWSPWGKFLRARDRVDALLFEEIRARRTVADLEERADVLSLLLQARDEDGSGMTDTQLRDELVTLLVAGHETTASQLAWTLERLLRTPAALTRLKRELPEGDDYLECVIKESQRTRPVLTYSALRTLTEPVELGRYSVPAGWTIAASAWLVQHRPELYPDPQAFRPERFEEGAPPPFSWVPFGGGVRRCLGAAFATYEMRIVLRTILERCELEAPDPKPEAMRRRAITFVPGKGGRVVLRRRLVTAWSPPRSAGA